MTSWVVRLFDIKLQELVLCFGHEFPVDIFNYKYIFLFWGLSVYPVMNSFQWPRRLLEGSCCLLIPPPPYTRTLWILSASQHSFYSCSYQYGHKAAAFLFALLSFSLTFSCTFIVFFFFFYWNRASQVVLVSCLPMHETYLFVGVLRWLSGQVWGDISLNICFAFVWSLT